MLLMLSSCGIIEEKIDNPDIINAAFLCSDECIRDGSNAYNQLQSSMLATLETEMISPAMDVDLSEYDLIYIDKNHFINFNLSEARQFKFWDIHSNKDKNNTLWGSGLFRYFDDYEAIRFIKKAIEIKKHDNAPAKEFLKYYCELHHLSLDDAI